ncbi:MAG: CARDB domain-containing protein [Candidatus Thermoplasmatota archaeon]|nr:CARDB domain-containing protein [Candidatus Thermoplasmatota archaeon]
MQLNDKRHSLALFIGIFFLSTVLIWQGNLAPFSLSVKEDENGIISDSLDESQGISTVSNRASFNYQQDLTVPFRWEEPLQGATKVQFSSSGYQTVALGFTFPFYDGSYSSINLFTHGYASFTSTISSSNNIQFPSNNPQYAKIIAPLWEYVYYWNAGPNSGIYYKALHNPERYLITWYQAPYDWQGGTCNFQLVLYKDSGNMLINYQRVTQNMRPTVGLNDGDGVHSNMPYYNNQRPVNSQSIVFGTTDNDVAMDRVLSPEPDTRVLPDKEIYINASVINYGFNAKNNVPVDLTITCDEDPGYLHSNSTSTSGNLGIMESGLISFKWVVPNQENRHYTVTLETVLSSPPDEVLDGNELEFSIIGKTFYDMGVWEVSRVKGEWYPYQEIPVTAKIANWGNIDTNCSVKMTVNGKHARFKETPMVSSGGVEGVMEPLIFNISFTWMVISPGKYTIAITTVLDNDEEVGNNIKSVVKDVVVSPFDVRMAFNGSTLNGKPNSVVSFKLTVYNDGEKKDDIQLNVTEYPTEEGWSKPVFDHNILRSMSRETSREVGLIVAIPPLAAAGLFTIRLKALSLGDGNTNITLGLLVNVLPDPKVSVQAPEGLKVYPGDTIRYNFTIWNNGNSADSFSIMTTSTNNWNTKVIGSPITDELVPNSPTNNQTIQITATVPENSLYGSTDILKVTAASLEDINVQSSSHVSTSVLQRHDVKIKATISEYAIHTERDVWISFNITNTGNGKDDTISFDVSTPYGWYTYIDDGKLHGGLERLYWAQILMKVRVPQGTANDVFPVDVNVLGGEVPALKDTFTFYFEILPEFGVNISSNVPLKTTNNEKSTNYQMIVKNTGNTYEAFNVSSPSEWLSFRSQGVPLEDIWLKANETRIVEAVVTVPPGTEADSDNSTNQNDPHSFIIEVASSSNPKAIHDITTIYLSIDPDADHVLFAKFASLKVARKRQEQTLDYQLYVENTGNVKDIIHLGMNISSQGPILASVSPINVHLSHRETKAVILTLRVRPDAVLGSYQIVIETTSDGNKSFGRRLTLTVDVVDYDFRISFLSINGFEISSENTPRLKRNYPINVGVLVENLGSDRFEGIYGENLSVAFYLGTTPIYSYKIRTLDRSESKQISFEWRTKVMGKRELIVVVNSNNEIPESVTDNNEVRAEIEVVTEIHSPGDELGKEGAPEIIFYVGIILISLLSGIIIFSLLFLLRKRNKMEGYDEEGEYRPDIYSDRLERKEIGIDLDEWGDLYSEPDEEKETGAEGYFIGSGEALTPPIVRRENEDNGKEGQVRGGDQAPQPVLRQAAVSQAFPVLSDGVNSVPVGDEEIKLLPPAGTDTSIEEHGKKTRTIITKPVTAPVTKSQGEPASMLTKPVGKLTKPIKSGDTPDADTETGTHSVPTRPVPTKALTKPVRVGDASNVDSESKSHSVPTRPVPTKVLTKSIMSGDTPDTDTETGTHPVPARPVPTRVMTKPIKIGDVSNVDMKSKSHSSTLPIPTRVLTKPVLVRDAPNVGTESKSHSVLTRPVPTRVLTKPVLVGDAPNVDTESKTRSVPTRPVPMRVLTKPAPVGDSIMTIPVEIVEKPVPDSGKGKNVRGSHNPPQPESENKDSAPTPKISNDSQKINDTSASPVKNVLGDPEKMEDELDELLRDVESL